MENEIFDFESLDGNVEQMKYWDITLKQNVGEYQNGSKFDVATINFDTGHLSLYRVSEHEQRQAPEEILVGRYQMKLQITADLLAD